MHPSDLVDTERDVTRREARIRDNTGWALQYHPRIKAIWDQGKAEAQSLVEQRELGADRVVQDTREKAAAETRLVFYKAWEKRYSSNTLMKKSNLQIDDDGAPGYHSEKTALTILSELGMLDTTNEG
jgi:hypothetical protein